MTPSDERPQIGDKIRSRNGDIGVVCASPPHAVSYNNSTEIVWAYWKGDENRPLYTSLKGLQILERAKPDYNDEEWI